MTPEKDATLCAKYPKIFRDRNAPMNQTAMCWGFECGDGWYDLIDVLCGNIQNHVDWKVRQQGYKVEKGEVKPEDAVPEEDLQVVAVQVKSKFSELRFYTSGCDPEVDGMISMAESMSRKICEECGNRGKIRNDPWVTNYCDPCYDEYKRKRYGK